MLYHSSYALRCAVRLSVILLIVGCAQVLGFSQGSGRDTIGTGGNNVINGKIFFPSGRRADGTIQVKLSSYTSSDITVIADSNGSFTFASISPGNYTIEIDAGKEYEVARERVTVDRDLRPPTVMDSTPATGTGRRYTVMINLQLKATENNGKAAVINAELAQVPDEARSLYEQAVTISQSGNVAKAIDNLRAAISIYPNFPLALNELGVEYLKSGDARRAVEPLRTAAKLKPDAYSPRLNLGIALLETHQFGDAQSQLREALKISSTPAAHMYLGITLIGVNRYDDAQHELETAVNNGGDNLGQAHRYLGGLYWQKKDSARAITEFERYLQLTPNAPDADRIRGTIKQLRANP